MSKGYVYVLTNPAMPGYVKIGRTTGDVHARAAQLFSTGVPLPFQVAASFLSPDCAILEAECHKRLEGHRVDTGREFFSVSISQAIDCVENAHMEQIDEWLEEYLPDHKIVHPDLAIDPGDMSFMANTLNVPDPIIASAFSVITPEEMMVFVQRFQEKTAKPLMDVSE